MNKTESEQKPIIDVKRVIKERGFTIAEVADKLGKHRVTLAQTITRNPTVETLQKIAEAIGCNIGDFFTRTAATDCTSDFLAMIRRNGEYYHATSERELADLANGWVKEMEER